jgi:hypothetical protein
MWRERAVLREGGRGAAEADDAYLVCQAREGYLDVGAAGRLARPAGLPGCAATGQPSRRRGRRPEAFGLASDVAYLAGMLSTGASIAVWTASSRMGNAPGDKADRWASTRDSGALAFTGPWQRHQNRRDQLRALQNGPRRRARPAAPVTRLPILTPAPRCSGPWRRSPRTSSTTEEEP